MSFVSPVKKCLQSAGILTQLGLTFVMDLTVACLTQVRLVLSPQIRIQPRWVAFDSRLNKSFSRVVLGILVSLTPGTVTADLRDSRLLLHVLDASSDREVIDGIRARLERPLKRLEELWP